MIFLGDRLTIVAMAQGGLNFGKEVAAAHMTVERESEIRVALLPLRTGSALT